MKTFLKKAKKALAVGGGIYAFLFLVFYFDLDGKLLFYVYEPIVMKHYDNMDHSNIADKPYDLKEDDE